MATTQLKSKQKVEAVEDTDKRLARLTELSTELLDGFLHCASRMCGSDIKCDPRQGCVVTAEDLEKQLKKPICVNSVKAQGFAASGFFLVLSREALFTLAGIAAGQPEETILQNINRGTTKSASQLGEILTQFGEVFVCSQNMCSRKDSAANGRFERIDTFIGNPWGKSKARTTLCEAGELVCLRYEMTVVAYPAFECSIIFPKEILASHLLLPATPTADASEEPADQQVVTETTDQKEPDLGPKSPGGESLQQRPRPKRKSTKKKAVGQGKGTAQPEAKASPAATKTKAVREPIAQTPTGEPPTAVDQETADSGPDTSDDAVTENRKTRKSRQREKGPVSKSIQEITESPAVLPGEGLPHTPTAGPCGSAEDAAQTITAEDIMQENILWGDSEQSVQGILAKMQQYDVAYVLIGNPPEAEGIVSESNLKEALSPYLHAPFDKYKRPLDEATLQIKVKWVMSKPVQSVERQTTVSAMMERMCECGLQVLTVRDQEKGIQGLLTTFDIFSALLKARSDTST
ncbi:MAG: CBS domain-containing protein, partial [Planctomycetota bacterium]|jgi:predicted transcriptional regulator